MVSWPVGYDLVILKETDSTNKEAIRRIGSLKKPTWIITEIQTEGKGRRGRTWLMPKGNFAATLMLKPNTLIRESALQSFVMALAVRSSFIIHFGNSDKFKLKWPNDVLLNNGKVAGILLESIGKGREVDNLLIGIGINLANAPKTHEVDPSSGSPVSIKEELGLTLSPIDFLYTLADQYIIYDNKINNEGFDLIRSEWIAHAANLEKQIVARLGSTEIKGSFLKIDDNGTLVLKNSNGIKKITAADIHFEEN